MIPVSPSANSLHVMLRACSRVGLNPVACSTTFLQSHALWFDPYPPTICLPARPICPSRFVSTNASPCTAPSRTTLVVSEVCARKHGAGRVKIEARKARKRFWADPQPVPPWECGSDARTKGHLISCSQSFPWYAPLPWEYKAEGLLCWDGPAERSVRSGLKARLN